MLPLTKIIKNYINCLQLGFVLPHYSETMQEVFKLYSRVLEELV